MPYDHQFIEKKWQERWERGESWRASEDPQKKDKKFYALDMFPYPSGAGLHVGHPKGYIATDLISRKRRMQGYNVLHPMGWDAFGLPAENYAIKVGIHPRETTKKNIETFKRQIRSMSLSYDWSREIATCDPEYYKWTQWFFLFLLEKDLAYRASAPVNWCDACQTVLANEQVVNGTCERCKNVVIQKEMSQWFFRITKFADSLLEELDGLDWPESIKAMQRNWIGRSEGAEITFHGFHANVDDPKEEETKEFSIPVFTTRPDTLFGVSYIVLAPEHPLVDALTHPDYRDAVVVYRDEARKKSELERTMLEREKTGTPIGAVVRHPFTGEEIPIWIADYVIATYGTGAVMGVPAHDERDFLFAQKYGLPIRQVIASMMLEEGIHTTDESYGGSGILVNSGEFNGITNEDAKRKIVDALASTGHGSHVTQYHLRDWLVSRQRYWGAPIPVIWCESCGMVPVPLKDLPVLLPDDVDFRPTGESPLARSVSFHEVHCPKCGAPARRESDTMDTFVDSSWYFLRYPDPKNETYFSDAEKMKYWCPVDLYVGGAEHAVMHLLYARFFTHVLHKHGLIDFKEPFHKLASLGLILGPDGQKMSKSRGNVINPDDVVTEYGADAMRTYEMFMGPFADSIQWDPKGIVGVRRFLEKVWGLKEKIGDVSDVDVMRRIHKAIKKVDEDTEAFAFNTAVAELMSTTNLLQEQETISREEYEILLQLLAPFAPHVTEEIWEQLGHGTSIFVESWPVCNPELAKDDMIEIAIQVNGKLRATIHISPELSQEEVSERALADQNVQRFVEGKKIVKIVYVPERLLNVVVK